MKTKRKFLHIEILNGQLYVYAADNQFDAKEIILAQIDNECRIDDDHVVIRPEELMVKPKKLASKPAKKKVKSK